MNKKKAIIISVSVLVAGVITYFILKGSKNKNKSQQGGDNPNNDGGGGSSTSTQTSQTSGLSAGFPITMLCEPLYNKNGEKDYRNTKIPDDWDLYVVTLKNKNSYAQQRYLTNDLKTAEKTSQNDVVLPSETEKGKYDRYEVFNSDDMNLKHGRLLIASKNLRNNRYRKIYLTKQIESDKTNRINKYFLQYDGQCTKIGRLVNPKQLDRDYVYMDKSVIKPLKDVDPARYQQELHIIKNQIANKDFLG
jgi:hypothetical protein